MRSHDVRAAINITSVLKAPTHSMHPNVPRLRTLKKSVLAIDRSNDLHFLEGVALLMILSCRMDPIAVGLAVSF